MIAVYTHQMPDDAVEQLYHLYYQPIVRYLNRIVSDYAAAEDLGQETFIKAMRHWNGLLEPSAVRGWLYRIATNVAYDYLRHQRRTAQSPLTEDIIVDGPGPEYRIDQESIWRALNRLPERYRLPLILHSLAGYSLNDIAVALGCNVSTIKSRVHRARTQFRQYYHA